MQTPISIPVPVPVPQRRTAALPIPEARVVLPPIPDPKITLPVIHTPQPIPPLAYNKTIDPAQRENPIRPDIIPPLEVAPPEAAEPVVRVPPITMLPIETPTQEVVVQKELQLREWQTEWAARAYNILLSNYGYIDTSRMGSGKTYVTLWLAKQFGFRLLIVCPVTMIEIWKTTAAEYGVPVIDIISYQSLRSQRDHQPKHGYLERFDNVTEGGTRQVNFAATRAYLTLVEQGIMVVCDEIQNIKNSSAQYKACNAMLTPIITAGGLSRFALLSGTPFDKEEHAINLLKLIGYIRAHRLFVYIQETRELILEGMQELIDACHAINAAVTDEILAEIPLVKSKMTHLAFTLYTRVVKAGISGAMPTPTTITGRFDVGNGFYNIDHERAINLQAAIDELAGAVRFNERAGTAQIRADNIGAVTLALVHIENAKAFDMSRVATTILQQNPRNRVVISVNYNSTVEELRSLLLPLNPLILTGSIPAKKRGNIVRTFRENPANRLLIMNTAVGGVGISLHDTTGEWPVSMLISPSYKLLEVTQAAARIYRDGTASDAVVRMFYGKGDGMSERNILTAMARKTQVLKGTFDDTVTTDLILPGDYKSEIEADE